MPENSPGELTPPEETTKQQTTFIIKQVSKDAQPPAEELMVEVTLGPDGKYRGAVQYHGQTFEGQENPKQPGLAGWVAEDIANQLSQDDELWVVDYANIAN